MTNIYDTKLVINCIKHNEFSCISFSEMSLFEMMKNKTRRQAKVQFEHVYRYVKKTNSILFSHLSEPCIFDLKLCAALQIARKLKKEIGYKLVDNILESLCIILILNMLFRASNFQKEERIINLEELICSVQNVIYGIKTNETRKLLFDYVINNKSESIQDELLVSLYNTFVTKINESSVDLHFKMKTISHYSINEMIENVDCNTICNFINQYIDKVVSFRINDSNSKTFYKKYYIYLYTKKNKIEINDYIDMNIAYAAFTNGIGVTTTDINFKNTYEDLIPIILVKD